MTWICHTTHFVVWKISQNMLNRMNGSKIFVVTRIAQNAKNCSNSTNWRNFLTAGWSLRKGSGWVAYTFSIIKVTISDFLTFACTKNDFQRQIHWLQTTGVYVRLIHIHSFWFRYIPLESMAFYLCAYPFELFYMYLQDALTQCYSSSFHRISLSGLKFHNQIEIQWYIYDIYRLYCSNKI